MADLSAGYDLPNPFGLRAVDFDHDIDGYGIALAFLGDLASGSDEAVALEANGANAALLRAWQASDKFRRVYAKCRAAGEAEREALVARESDSAATEDGEAGDSSGQRFIPLEDAPVQPRSVFHQWAAEGSGVGGR